MEYVSLKEVVHIKHGYAFKGEFFTEENTGKIVLTPGNFSLSGGFIPTKKYTKEEGFPEEFILKANDLIVTMTDLSKEIDTIGFAALIPSDDKLYLHNQRIGLVTIISNDFDKDYIYWLMRTKCYQRTIANTSNGATVHHTSPDRIYKYKFKRISLPIQQKIASILSAYDRLIENNTRRIRLLEQMAENLYKEWFVRFRFPEHENVEMVNGLPKRWKVKRYEEELNIRYGKGLSTEQLKEEGYPVFGSNGQIGFYDSYMYEDPQILISCRGASSGIVNISLPKSFITSNSLICERTEKTESLYEYLKYYFLNNNLVQYQTGSAQPQITINNIVKLKLLVPELKVQRSFSEKIRVIDMEIYNLQSQIQLLTRQRDLLLPRLMSGKLEVKS